MDAATIPADGILWRMKNDVASEDAVEELLKRFFERLREESPHRKHGAKDGHYTLDYGGEVEPSHHHECDCGGEHQLGSEREPECFPFA